MQTEFCDSRTATISGWQYLGLPQHTFVAIIDPDERTRASLSSLLSTVGIDASTYRSALELLAENARCEGCGCVIVDALLPGIDALELQRQLGGLPVPPPVIVVSAQADVPTAVELMRAGVVDFLEKPPRPQVVLSRVNEALERYARDRQEHNLRMQLRARYDRLTPREREVMELVSVGYPNKAVAQRLGVTRKAVEAYRARVMRKMEAESLPMLVRECVVLNGEARSATLRTGAK